MRSLSSKLLRFLSSKSTFSRQALSSDTVMGCKWNISEFFENQNNCKYAVLILNRRISQNHDFIKNFWNNATLRITVDGGTVHWENFVKDLPDNDEATIKLPNLITGDFDSITKEVMDKYKKNGCKILHTPDQNYTDFTKALIELKNHCDVNDIQVDHVIAIAQSSGRIDQILANIQTLHLVKEEKLLQSQTKMYIMSDDALTWLLDPGDHKIDIPKEIRQCDKHWCALIPVGEPCKNVTTSGLKWNLDNQSLKFGQLVSTSNTYDGSEHVTIQCSNTLLWAMEVPNLSS